MKYEHHVRTKRSPSSRNAKKMSTFLLYMFLKKAWYAFMLGSHLKIFLNFHGGTGKSAVVYVDILPGYPPIPPPAHPPNTRGLLLHSISSV